MIKVLTIWQPWAWLIARGYKDVENRSRRTHHRGEVLIHVGQRWRERETTGILDELVERGLITKAQRPGLDELRGQLGKVIARVELVACERSDGHASPWAVPGGFVFELEGATELAEPIAMQGRRGLVEAPAELVALLRSEPRGAR